MSTVGKQASGGKYVSVAVRGIVTVVILAIGIAIAGGLISTRESAKRVTEPPPPRIVQTVRVAPTSIPRTWSAYGTARALVATEIGAEVSAVVLRRPESIQPGIRVDEGELIVKLDAHDFEQAAASARESIAALESQVRSLDVERNSLVRQVELAEESANLANDELQAWVTAGLREGPGEIEINRQRRSVIALEREAEVQRERLNQIPSRRANLAAQIQRERTNLQLATRNIERCTIRAPYDGRLQRVDVQAGERVAPGETVARIVDLSMIEVPLRVALSSASSVRPGDRVSLGRTGGDAPAWEGRVSRIAPEADSASRSITVFAVVEQDDEGTSGSALLPGQFLVGEIEGRLIANALPIPRSSIDEDRVLVVSEGGTIEQRSVTVEFFAQADFPAIDPNEHQWAIVSGGLSSGDRVVTSNLDELRVGMTVTATGPATLETARAANGKAEG